MRDGEVEKRGRVSGGMPTVRKQGVESVFVGRGKQQWKASEDVTIIGPRVMAVAFAGGQEAEVDRRRMAAAFAAAE